MVHRGDAHDLAEWLHRKFVAAIIFQDELLCMKNVEKMNAGNIQINESFDATSETRKVFFLIKTAV